MLMSHSNTSFAIIPDTQPTTILWSQTLKSITLQINIKHVHVFLAESYLKLSNQTQRLTLPLYGNVYLQQEDIKQITEINNTILLTLNKEISMVWPHLLTQQTDQEISRYLLEANFLLQIHHLPSFDMLDFDTVVNSQGQKTGLE